MRIWLFSDFHLEHHKISENEAFSAGLPDADVCVVPGDMHTGDAEIEVLAERVAPSMPVIITHGNHSFYGRSIDEMRELTAEIAARRPNVHLLDPGVVVIDGVRFVGATLWTDYDLNGEARRRDAMAAAARSINDHQSIAAEPIKRDGSPTRAWTPAHARARHLEERAFIDAELAKPFDGKTVVVTHHAPHPGSIHRRFRDPRHDLLNAAFVSNLESMILDRKPDLWLHGHVHNLADYLVGTTRLVANPRGYQVYRGTPANVTLRPHPDTGVLVDPETERPPEPHHQGPENPDFDPLLVLEI